MIYDIKNSRQEADIVDELGKFSNRLMYFCFKLENQNFELNSLLDRGESDKIRVVAEEISKGIGEIRESLMTIITRNRNLQEQLTPVYDELEIVAGKINNVLQAYFQPNE